MSKMYIATAAAVKVSIGGAGGNRVARILRRSDIVPDGVSEDHIERLLERGMIELVDEPDDTAVTIPQGEPTEKWNGKQLAAYAAEKGIDLGSAKTKADIVAAITAANAGN